MLEADITFREVGPPPNRWCNGLLGGHEAPLTFAREGPGTPELETRFFLVTKKDGTTVGTFCEPCLTVASWWGRLTDEQKREAVRAARTKRT